MSIRIIPKTEEGRDNRELVRQFFKENPFATQRDCQVATGLGAMAVSRHYRGLKAEWKTQKLAQANG